MIRIFFALILAAAVAAPVLSAQDETRQLWDSEFLQKRPAPKAKPTPKKAPKYRRATPPLARSTPAPGAPPVSDTLVGVTLWRLRRAMPGDAATAARMLVHEPASDSDVEWVPERIGVDQNLQPGQKVRLSIETPKTGYLYVIDREVYKDGSLGDPFLIFPTTRTRGGDNRVGPGAVIEIPSQTDSPPYFSIQKSRLEHVGESLIVIVSAEPLAELKIGDKAVALTTAQVEKWVAEWGASVERIEEVGNANGKYSLAEKAAGAAATGKLTQDDALPQSIYRVDGKAGKPLLVTVALRIM